MKKQIALLFGGKSAEHDVSVLSAKSIYKNIDKNTYDVYLLGIDMEGDSFLFSEEDFLNAKDNGFNSAKKLSLSEFTEFLTTKIDLVFPALHGPFGEDGKLQGYLDFINVAYVGCNHASSALCMDKAYNKYILQNNGFSITPFKTIIKHEYDLNNDKIIDEIISELGTNLFIKPANMGSSVGISKTKNKSEIINAIQLAFEYDKVLVAEKAINAAEFECGIFGKGELKATPVGEIIPSHEFYDYEAKYSSDALSKIEIPAKLSEKDAKYMKEESIRAAKLFRIEGLSRIDFLMDKDDGRIYLSEINTMPGFTQYSMYPSLIEKLGIDYTSLISKLIELVD